MVSKTKRRKKTNKYSIVIDVSDIKISENRLTFVPNASQKLLYIWMGNKLWAHNENDSRNKMLELEFEDAHCSRFQFYRIIGK